MPTILDWAGVPAPSSQRLAGRSILPILEQASPTGWDRVFASHGFHEVQQYYPMRALRTREYKYIVNLAAPLEFPIAGDIASSPTWRAIAARPGVGLGARTVDAFLHRPAEELYDLRKDAAEVRNLAGDPAHRQVLERMRAEVTKFRADTRDPWLPGQAGVFGHEAKHGKLRINIDQAYPLDAAAKAQEHNRSGSTRGKVVIDTGVAAETSRRSSQLQPNDAGHDEAQAD